MSVLEKGVETPGIAFPSSVEEALAILDAHPGDAQIIGGGTWLMRAGVRGEKLPAILVSLERIEGIDAIVRRENRWSVGPMVTHEALARHFGTAGALEALGQAAGNSANPGIRRLATLGGNVATAGFAAADLVPALIALDASVRIAEKDGTISIPVENYLGGRTSRSGLHIVIGLEIADTGSLSAHARLTMRRAGEYPVAVVSVAAKISERRRIEALRIAVGSVEQNARRWRGLENALVGQMPDLAEIEAATRANLADLAPREGTDAPAWYRLEVLPHLVRTAFADIAGRNEG